MMSNLASLTAGRVTSPPDQSKGIALTKKIVYQDFRNIDLFGRKGGENVEVKI